MAEPLVTKPAPDAARYVELKEEAQRWRKDLAAKYAKARSKEDKDKVIAETPLVDHRLKLQAPPGAPRDPPARARLARAGDGPSRGQGHLSPFGRSSRPPAQGGLAAADRGAARLVGLSRAGGARAPRGEGRALRGPRRRV